MMSSARRAASRSVSFVGAGDGMLVSSEEILRRASRFSGIQAVRPPVHLGSAGGATSVVPAGGYAGSDIGGRSPSSGAERYGVGRVRFRWRTADRNPIR